MKENGTDVQIKEKKKKTQKNGLFMPPTGFFLKYLFKCFSCDDVHHSSKYACMGDYSHK